MTAGVALATAEADPKFSLETTLALDTDPAAMEVHSANFPRGEHLIARVEDLFDGELGARLTRKEHRTRLQYGEIDLLVGGPPCQGNSNLNNHSRRNDPRNALYARMARAAQVLSPTVVIIENVPAVIHDRRGVVKTTKNDLRRQGYEVSDAVVSMTFTGVPQLRKRHVLVATRSGTLLDPQEILMRIVNRTEFLKPRDIRWAISDLRTHWKKSDDIFETPSVPSEENFRRMEYLIKNQVDKLPNRLRPKCHQNGNHSYYSVYGRMNWKKPAQTITTGFGSTGQGCYVHPDFPRTITPHEAARLQTFPDFFDFSRAGSRTALARMIGNAVPPFFMRALVREVLPAL